MVTDDKADGDKNVYVQDSNGNRTGEVIGTTVSDALFVTETEAAIKGTVIDLRNQSGVNFLNNEIMANGGLGLIEYMMNATGGQPLGL